MFFLASLYYNNACFAFVLLTCQEAFVINTVFVLFHFFAADSEDSTVSIQIKLENEGSDEDIETDVLYSPQMALKLALTEWLQEFGVPHQYSSKFGHSL